MKQSLKQKLTLLLALIMVLSIVPVHALSSATITANAASQSDAEFLQERAATILTNGLTNNELRLSANNNAILTLVIDGRTFVLATGVNNRNVSGRVELPDGSGTLIFDIRGNGSNVREFTIVKNDVPPPPPPPDAFDYIFILFDDFTEDRVRAPFMDIPRFDGTTSPPFTQTNPDTITGLYYDVFVRFGRVAGNFLNHPTVDGRTALQVASGWHYIDGNFNPELGHGVHMGPYEIRLVAGIGLTPDNAAFRPTGNRARAERELYIHFGTRTFWGTFNASPESYNESIGDARAFSLFGYRGTGAADRYAFAGFNLRYSDANNGVLEAHIIENGVATRVQLGTTPVFAVENSNVWFDINIYARMATCATANDGIFRIYVDGAVEIELTDLNWFDPVFGFNDIGWYSLVNCHARPFSGNLTRWYSPLRVARIPLEDAVQTDPFETRLRRFNVDSGRRQQQLTDDRTHFDLTMQPGTPEFVLRLWPLAPDAEIWVGGQQFQPGQDIAFPLTAFAPRPAFADETTGNQSWGIVDRGGVFEVEIRPMAGANYSRFYTFSVEMLVPFTVYEDPQPEWLWWDDFSDWGNTINQYQDRGRLPSVNPTHFFGATPGTGLGGGWSLESPFFRSTHAANFSTPGIAFQFYDPFGTNIIERPDGLPLPPGRTIDYEAAGFPPGTNAYIDNRRLNPGPGNMGGDIDDMFVRFYVKMDRHWGNYLLWDDPSFWGPSRPGGPAGNNGQDFILEGAGGGHDKLMRFMGRTRGTNYTVQGPFSGQAPLGPQGGFAPTTGAEAQTFILHVWTMGGPHPHHFLGLDAATGVDVGRQGSNRLWAPTHTPGAGFAGTQAAWEWKRTEILAQFDAINAINAQPLDQRPPGSMPGTAAPGSGHAVITERQNHFDYMGWVGATLSGGQFPNIPIFDNDHVGEWYRIEQRVRLNTPGLSDGIMQLWINCKLVASRTDINFRGWNIEAGITRIQLEVYANAPRGATVDASRYISNLVASTAFIGPAQFSVASPEEDARRVLRNIIRAQIGPDFDNPVWVLQETPHTAATWGPYAAAVATAVIVYNTSNDIGTMQDAGQLILDTRAALVLREVVLVELPVHAGWTFWHDFDGGNCNGIRGGSINYAQPRGTVLDGVGVNNSYGLQSDLHWVSPGHPDNRAGNTAVINFPAKPVAYIRFYTRSDIDFVGNGGFWASAWYGSMDWGTHAIRFDTLGPGGAFGIAGGQALPGTAGVLSSAEWVGIELRFDMIARNVTVWIDGILGGTVPIPATSTMGNQISAFRFHAFTDMGQGYRFYDNFVVSSSRIGPMERQFADGGAVVNKAALTAAIDAEVVTRNPLVFVRDAADYTQVTWDAFVAVIEAAIAVEADTNATQAQVNTAIGNITAAIGALVLAPTGGPPLVEHPQPEWLFHDDFSTAGVTTITSERAIRVAGAGIGGGYAVRLDYAGASSDSIVCALRVTFSPTPVVYFRYYLRMGTNWPVGGPIGIFNRLNQWHQQASLGLWGGGPNAGFPRRNWDPIPPATGVSDETARALLAPTAANIGQWIPIEVRMQTVNGPGGSIRVWVNDVLSFENNNIAINLANFNSLCFTFFPETVLPAGAHLYITNLVISTQRIGLACVEGCDCLLCDSLSFSTSLDVLCEEDCDCTVCEYDVEPDPEAEEDNDPVVKDDEYDPVVKDDDE